MFRHDLRNSGCFEIPWADIMVAPAEILVSLAPNQQEERIVTVTNDGELDLDFTITVFTASDSAWLDADPLEGVVTSDSSMEISVTLDASGIEPGLHSGELRIHSNDPTDSLVTVPVTLEVTPTFIRGDGNGDGNLTVADAVYLISYVYRAGPVACEDCCDANDDGGITSADAIYIVSHIYRSGFPPPNPFPDCGPDPTDDQLGCTSHPCMGMK